MNEGYFFLQPNLSRSLQELEFQKILMQFSVFQFEIDDILTKIFLNTVGVSEEMQKIFSTGKEVNVITHFESSQTTITPANLYQAS